MEIVFVDDGSKDDTLKVIKDYASRIGIQSTIFSGPWRGVGKARNTVIDNARGDYIFWVDADELFERDFVRKQVRLFEKNAKAGIVTAKLGILPDENLILALDLLPGVVEYALQDWKAQGKLPGTGGAAYRVAAAREVGGFDGRIESIGEDIELASRIRQAGWTILRGEALFYERHMKFGTWRTLWNRYVKGGSSGRRLYRQTNEFSSFYRINPISSLIASFRYTILGYMLTKRRDAFLLPFHFNFKMLAWFYGFSKE
jgi:glycosyltransferase involved in cell wall biosynthesis